MNPAPTPTAELLAAHVGWIRELARHMTADAHQAEDLAQEACVVALERPPRDAEKLRGWIAAVMRNWLRQSGRGETRRAARERAAAREERSTEDLVEQVALQRELVEAVLELAEPYRTAILLRFFEELPPREIARRLDVPVNTVQSRIARGLERLRERLDDAHGGRSWLLVLLPLAERPEGVLSTSLLTGGVIVNAKLLVALALLAVVGLLATAVAIRDRADEHPLAAAAAAAPPSETAPSASVSGLEAPQAGTGRADAAPVSEPSAVAAAPAAEPATRTLRGRVFDASGEPVAGVDLRIDATTPSPIVARSGSGGWFELATDVDSGALVPHDTTRWETVRMGRFRRGSAFEPTPIVAARIAVGGRVVDEQGVPMEGVQVSLVLPRAFEARFAVSLEGTWVVNWRTRSDASGAYAFASLPQIEGASLRAALDGYRIAEEPLPAASTPALDFVLARPVEALSGDLRGQVVDPSGRPVEGARVALGLALALTDASGTFGIDLARAVTAERVRAVKAGHRPAAMDRPGEPGPGSTGWPDFVTLQLGGPPLAIAGRVVDEHGEPRAGVRVWLADPTRFGSVGMMPVQLEALMAGAVVPPQAVESARMLPEEDGDLFWDNTATADVPPTALWSYVRTDSEGRFELGGLEEREYRLRMMDDAALALHTTDPISAGTRTAEVVMPRPPVHAKVAGRVTTAGGAPLANVNVRAFVVPFESRGRVFGGTFELTMVQPRPSVATDAEGRFELADLPREGVSFYLQADSIVPARHELAPDADPLDIVIRVEARCPLEVELDDPIDRADAIGVADAEGEGLDVWVISEGHVNAYTSVPLVAGRSGVVSVSSSATKLLLMKEGAVVDEVPIALRPGEINRIEP